MIRGLRDGTDLDYEMQMAGMNETMAPGIQTVSCRPAAVRTITATLVRQIAAMGGDIRPSCRRGRRRALSPNSRQDLSIPEIYHAAEQARSLIFAAAMPVLVPRRVSRPAPTRKTP